MNNDQKIENLLNLALEASDAEREKSLNLNQGYDRETKTWELIVRYHGDIWKFQNQVRAIITLSCGYAIVTVE